MKSYNGFTPQQRLEGDKIIKKAIEEGILKSPNECRCSACGQDKGIRHYHNEDYSKENIINDAKCLCWRCHLIWHSRFSFKEECRKYFKEIKEGKIYPPVYKNNIKILEEHGIKYENRRNANK